MQIGDVVVGSVLSMGLTYGLVCWDRLRMPEGWRQRGWNAASTGAAVFTFSPLCIVAHYWVTRRSALGLLKGVMALLLLSIAQVGLTMVYEEHGLVVLVITLMHPVALPGCSLRCSGSAGTW